MGFTLNQTTQHKFGKTGEGSFLNSVLKEKWPKCPTTFPTYLCEYRFKTDFKNCVLVEQTLHWLTNLCHLIEKFITQPCLRLFLAYAGSHLKWSMKICHLYSNGSPFYNLRQWGYVFHPVYICWLVGRFVSRMTRKLLNRFPQNLDWGWVPAQNRPH